MCTSLRVQLVHSLPGSYVRGCERASGGWHVLLCLIFGMENGLVPAVRRDVGLKDPAICCATSGERLVPFFITPSLYRTTQHYDGDHAETL